MKKLLIAVLTAALILGTGTTSAFAAGRGHGHCSTQTTCKSPDADKNGICDNCGKNDSGQGHGHHRKHHR